VFVQVVPPDRDLVAGLVPQEGRSGVEGERGLAKKKQNEQKTGSGEMKRGQNFRTPDAENTFRRNGK